MSSLNVAKNTKIENIIQHHHHHLNHWESSSSNQSLSESSHYHYPHNPIRHYHYHHHLNDWQSSLSQALSVISIFLYIPRHYQWFCTSFAAMYIFVFLYLTKIIFHLFVFLWFYIYIFYIFSGIISDFAPVSLPCISCCSSTPQKGLFWISTF